MSSMMRGSVILRLDSGVRVVVVVVVLLLLLSLPRAAFGILGFDDEAGSCELSSALASEVLTLEVAGCEEYRAPCSASSYCESCIWVPDEQAVVTCWDGCAYCDALGNCVERSTSGVRGVATVGTTTQQYVVLQRLGLLYTFTAGNYTGITFSFSWEPGLLGKCSAKWMSQECVCAQTYCDESQTDFGYTADCTAIPGGTVMNTCLPDSGLVFQEGSTLMDILVLFPGQKCQRAATTPGGGVETTSTVPPATTTTGGDSGATTTTTTDGAASSNAAASLKKWSGFPYVWTASSCLSWIFFHAFLA
jgi:hypothetical protein